jgi:hypothetical protein
MVRVEGVVVLALDLESVKDAKERTGNQNQVAKLQVRLLVSGFVVVGIFLFKGSL